MKSCILVSFILILNFFTISGKSQGFDRTNYYAVLASTKLERVNAEITSLKEPSIEEKEAYHGTLLMKKAGLVGAPMEKLRLFKSGRLKLESAIANDNDNIEFRLLRVIIQEHAPKIVKYHNEVENDCRLINKNFKTLPPYLKQAIVDYSKTSKALKIS